MGRLSRWLDFQGRAGRLEFWAHWIGFVVFGIALLMVVALLRLPVVTLLLLVPAGLVLVAAAFRRMHDRGRRMGWFLPALGAMTVADPAHPDIAWRNIVAALGSLVLVWVLSECMFRPGVWGPNRFGEDPLA